MTELTPPDKKQCQVVIYPPKNPFRLGPQPKERRCGFVPVFIMTEVEKDLDGRRGAMSVCQHCYVEFLQKPEMPAVTLEAI